MKYRAIEEAVKQAEQRMETAKKAVALIRERQAQAATKPEREKAAA